jgi:3-phosphoshikimate 1-carboxyvinyltransferase
MSKAVISATQSFNFISDKIAADKSISHRCAMFATLADGESVIRNFLRAEDTLNSLEIVKKLGATVVDDGEVIKITSHGIKESEDILDCGNAGTGMRLFCGLLASADGHFVLTGDE